MDCVFCGIIRGEIPSTNVFENENVLAFQDIHPVAKTHYLIVPKQHISSALEVTPENASHISDLYLAANAIARQENISGFKLQMNVGPEGGQIVMHVHLHMIAGRWLSKQHNP